MQGSIRFLKRGPAGLRPRAPVSRGGRPGAAPTLPLGWRAGEGAAGGVGPRRADGRRSARPPGESRPRSGANRTAAIRVVQGGPYTYSREGLKYSACGRPPGVLAPATAADGSDGEIEGSDGVPGSAGRRDLDGGGPRVVAARHGQPAFAGFGGAALRYARQPGLPGAGRGRRRGERRGRRRRRAFAGRRGARASAKSRASGRFPGARGGGGPAAVPGRGAGACAPRGARGGRKPREIAPDPREPGLLAVPPHPPPPPRSAARPRPRRWPGGSSSCCRSWPSWRRSLPTTFSPVGGRGV
jgi:hypothetical protein